MGSKFIAGSNDVEVEGPNGALAGVLEMPEGEPISTAIFAHCFTCGKDFLPEKRITKELADNGVATLRVDFSGIGSSEGKFEDSSFLTNLEDIYAAADWLRSNLEAPRLLVGHSLGGAAVLASAGKIEEVKAVATIGAPADPAHVLHLFENLVCEIEEKGVAKVPLAGREFNIGKKFVDDIKGYDYISNLNSLECHKLIMHSPDDELVELKNAGDIYAQLKHPKSFISLAGSNHLLTSEGDAAYVADMITVWAKKVL